jgi:methionyl-tRNA synthetase
MSQLSEIKCPHCEHWSVWTDKVDDKCTNCGEYLEPGRLAHREQMKVADAQRKNYYMEIKDTDETIVQLYKILINSVRWGAYYAVMLFFVFVAAILFVIGLIAI